MSTRVSSGRKLRSLRKFRRLSDLMKKPWRQKRDEMLAEFREKYPHQEFRIGSHSYIQRKMGKRWSTVCMHNRQQSVCAHPICDGSSVCKHKIRRSDCKKPECKGGGANCEHGFRKGQCKICGHLRCKHGILHYRCSKDGCSGTSLCKHKILRNICADPECGGGTSLCRHQIIRSMCRDPECEGGTAYCQHDKVWSKCLDPECGGGTAYCSHKVLKRFCPHAECKGGTGLCILCYVKVKIRDNFCITCHPDYVPAMSGVSKVGCEFICKLQKALGNIQIQHSHYDTKSMLFVRNEFRLPENKKKPVDGYYIDDQGQKIVVEFLGDIYHGHPSKWGPDEQNKNHYGQLHKDKFNKTEHMFTKVSSFGYIIRYVWENDYIKLKPDQSPLSILREFNGKLEY